jgi:DnaJ-class molecular chaperone
MRNRGIQILGTTRRGDQHTRVFIEVPQSVSSERRELLEKLAALDVKESEGSSNPSKKSEEASKGFFDHLKDMFA